MQKSVLLRELQKEIRRHDLCTFVEDPPSGAQGGKGVTDIKSTSEGFVVLCRKIETAPSVAIGKTTEHDKPE